MREIKNLGKLTIRGYSDASKNSAPKEKSAQPVQPPKSHEEIQEEKRRLAIEQLSKMCIGDDDVALVVVVSPYDRIQNIAFVIDGTTYEDPALLLRQEIEGSEVERAFVEAACTEIDRINCRHEEYIKEVEACAYNEGRRAEFNRIVSLLKGGTE